MSPITTGISAPPVFFAHLGDHGSGQFNTADRRAFGRQGQCNPTCANGKLQRGAAIGKIG
jgi:hypothetical protein